MSKPIENRENALLQHLQAGDERAFDYFFHRFYPLILLFAERFSPNTAVAEEVVQDVFYKAWEKRTARRNGPNKSDASAPILDG